MTGIYNETGTAFIAAGDWCELVRGEEQRLVDWLAPVVREQNVVLDLGHVNRIDAAGIAALIKLYGLARNAGHEFSVLHATRRVAEILTLVGLDGILLSHNADPNPQSGVCYERSAA